MLTIIISEHEVQNEKISRTVQKVGPKNRMQKFQKRVAVQTNKQTNKHNEQIQYQKDCSMTACLPKGWIIRLAAISLLTIINID